MLLKRALRYLLIAVSLLIAIAYFLSANQKPATSATDLGNLKIDYRPGGYFPKNFPLHGRVRLLTAPVAAAGQRVPIQVEYTVGDMPVETGVSLEVWKHFTSDVEAFQTASPDQPAYFAV